MKSTVGYMGLVYKYVERIVTVKEQGKFVATHGTQQHLEIYEVNGHRGSRRIALHSPRLRLRCGHRAKYVL